LALRAFGEAASVPLPFFLRLRFWRLVRSRMVVEIFQSDECLGMLRDDLFGDDMIGLQF
jgi:hypothetical protein